MGTSILELVGNVFGAIKEFFSFQSKKLDLKNTQEMKDAEKAQNEQATKDKINQAIVEKNEDEIRKGIS